MSVLYLKEQGAYVQKSGERLIVTKKGQTLLDIPVFQVDNIAVIGNVRYNRAVDAVHDNSLNVARTTFDDSVQNYNDSLNAVVFRQSPSASSAPIGMGGEVSLFFTLDESKLPQ